MNDERLKDVYTGIVESRTVTDRAACPETEAIRDLVERRGVENARLAVLDHVMACARCSREFELLRSVDRAAATHGLRSLPRSRLALAASVLLVLTATVIWRSTGTRQPTFRGDVDAVTLVGPTGDTDAGAPLRLTWLSAGPDVGYEIEILDESGTPRYATVTSDTTIVVPDTVGLAVGAIYRWWVQATLPDARTVRSTMSSFTPR